MSLFTDRRPLRQIGGLRAYLVQVGWSLLWRLRRRPATPASLQPERPPAGRRRGAAEPGGRLGGRQRAKSR